MISPENLSVSVGVCGQGSVQFSHSVMSDFATPWTAAHQTSLTITNSQSLLKLMSIELVMPSNHLILCHPLLLLPSIFPSVRVFSSESVLRIMWPKCWSLQKLKESACNTGDPSSIPGSEDLLQKG